MLVESSSQGLHAATVGSPVPVAYARCRAHVENALGLAQHELEIIDEAKQARGELCVQVGVGDLDDACSRHGFDGLACPLQGEVHGADIAERLYTSTAIGCLTADAVGETPTGGQRGGGI